MRTLSTDSLKKLFVVTCIISINLVDAASASQNPPPSLPIDLLVEEKTRGEGRFFAPNEYHNYIHFDELSAGQDRTPKAVISVGTFRAFNLLAASRRDYLIALDYSAEIAEFNRALAGLILKYDRQQLLGLLLGYARFDVPPGMDERQYIHNLSQARVKDRRADYGFYLAPPINDPDLKVVYKYLDKQQGMNPNSWMWTYAVYNFSLTRKKYESFFLGHEAGYQHVKDTIRKNRFVAVRGSISGDESMRSIGNALRSVGAVASEIDFSNALDHVVAAGKSAGLRSVARAVQMLPLNSESKVLLTIDMRFLNDHQKAFLNRNGPPPQRIEKGNWFYAVMDPGLLINRIAVAHDQSALVDAYVDVLGKDRKFLHSSCSHVFR